MDSIDAKIIELLAKNARMENKQIAKLAGVSDRTVARRVERLEETGAIKGYTVKLGLQESAKPEIGAEKVNTAISEWEGCRDSLERVFGSGSGVILFYIGYGMGKDLGEKIRWTGFEKGLRLLTFAQTLQDRGWGRMDFENLNLQEAKGRIVLDGSPFKKKSSKEPSCYEVKGMIAGCLETVFNEKVKVIEEKCVRKGDDRCEFAFEGAREHEY
jgi:DNA-binding Lrp family transcriptional regulator